MLATLLLARKIPRVPPIKIATIDHQPVHIFVPTICIGDERIQRRRSVLSNNEFHYHRAFASKREGGGGGRENRRFPIGPFHFVRHHLFSGPIYKIENSFLFNRERRSTAAYRGRERVS